jgi:uncharacterized protein YciI
MTTYYVVIRMPGALWDPTKDTRDQALWDEHARYMDRLFEEGAVILGGPFADGSGAMLIVKAENAAQARELFRDDPWTANDVLVIREAKEWIIFLDGLDRR